VIPLKDDAPSRTKPVVTISLIIINTAVFFYELSLGRGMKGFIFKAGFIPYEIVHYGISEYLTVFTSMFVHGGWFHLIGNMLYLWIFADNVEDCLGHARFLLFYLICGLAGSGAHFITSLASKVPAVGASGAISGVLGGYLLLYPTATVLTLIPLGFFIRIIRLPALIVLGFWIVLQLLNGLFGLAARGGGGIAWFAHIGGFFAGLVLVKLFQKRPALKRHRHEI